MTKTEIELATALEEMVMEAYREDMAEPAIYPEGLTEKEKAEYRAFYAGYSAGFCEGYKRFTN